MEISGDESDGDYHQIMTSDLNYRNEHMHLVYEGIRNVYPSIRLKYNNIRIVYSEYTYIYNQRISTYWNVPNTMIYRLYTMRILGIYAYADHRISTYIINIRVRIHQYTHRISTFLPCE